MQRLLDEKSRSVLSALQEGYVDTSQLDDYLSQYRALQARLSKEQESELSHLPTKGREYLFLPIPVAINSGDVISVKIYFLDGKTAHLLCPNTYKLADIRPHLSKHFNSFDPKDFLLGFSQSIDGETLFLDESTLLEKLGGKSKLLETNLILKFYMPDVLLLESPQSRHQMYLQLRIDLSESDRLYLTASDRIRALAFAVLAENIDLSCLSVDSNKLSKLVGWRVVEQLGNTKAETLLKAETNKVKFGLSNIDAELEFCKIVQTAQNYGKRYYRVYASKDFAVQLSSLYISLSIIGITIEEASPTISADLQPTAILHSFSWRQVVRFSFAWHRLTIGVKSPNQSHSESKNKQSLWTLHYYIRKKAIGNYLLQLAADLNQFQMSLLQTYRIDRMLFQKPTVTHENLEPLEPVMESSEFFDSEKLSSTLPRKPPSSKTPSSFDWSDEASPIFAFGGATGRSSAPPPTTEAPSSACEPKQQKEQLSLQKPTLLPQNTFAKNKWNSTQYFGRSEKDQQVQIGDYDEVDYNFATSIVPKEKLIQGMPQPGAESFLYNVSLERDETGSIGFSLSLDPETRYLIVKTMRPGGAADKCGQIAVGDRLVRIGEYDLGGKDYDDCVSLLRSINFPVTLTFERPIAKESAESESCSETANVIVEVLDPISYEPTKIPKETTFLPAYSIEKDFDEDDDMIYYSQSQIEEQINFENDSHKKISEDVVHEEVTYPTAEYSIDLDRNVDINYADDANPYAKTGDDVDDELIEQMLGVLGEADDEIKTSSFDVEVVRLDSTRGFGFSVEYNDNQAVITHVDREQTNQSGLTLGDVVVKVNNESVDKLEGYMQSEQMLFLSLLACVNIQEQQEKIQASHQEDADYAFHLPAVDQEVTLPQNDDNHIFSVSIVKQPAEELGCSLFSSGSEIFVGTVKPGSKLGFAGVKHGDMCVLINGEPVFGMPSEKVASALRTAVGKVSLTFSRPKSNNCFSRMLEKRKLSSANIAELRHLADIWNNVDIVACETEFNEILTKNETVSIRQASSNFSLAATWVELNGFRFILSNLPSQQLQADFWQTIFNNGVKFMVVLGMLPNGILPQQCDEVLRVGLPSIRDTLSIRLVCSTTPVDNAAMSMYSLTLPCSSPRDERMFCVIQCGQYPEMFYGGLVDALVWPQINANEGAAAESIAVIVCASSSGSGSTCAPTQFDWRGVFCVVSSILGLVFATSSRKSSMLITASSISDSAARLRRQHPESMCCVEQLASIYSWLAFSLDQLLPRPTSHHRH